MNIISQTRDAILLMNSILVRATNCNLFNLVYIGGQVLKLYNVVMFSKQCAVIYLKERIVLWCLFIEKKEFFRVC